MHIRQGGSLDLFVLFFTFRTDVCAAVTPEIPFCDENCIYLSIHLAVLIYCKPQTALCSENSTDISYFLN